MNIYVLHFVPQRAAWGVHNGHLLEAQREGVSIFYAAVVGRLRRKVLYRVQKKLVAGHDSHVDNLVTTEMKKQIDAMPDAPCPVSEDNPLVKWVYEHPRNFAWISRYLRSLSKEVKLRFGEYNEAYTTFQGVLDLSSRYELKFDSQQQNLNSFADTSWLKTRFCQVLPSEYQTRKWTVKNTVQAYRKWYIDTSGSDVLWGPNREAPTWWPAPPHRGARATV